MKNNITTLLEQFQNLIGTTQNTNKMRNMTQPIKTGMNHVFWKGNKFLFLIRQPPCRCDMVCHG